MFTKSKYNHLPLVYIAIDLIIKSMYIAINNCDWKDTITHKCHAQPTMLVSRSEFAINKHRWLRLTVNQVSVALIVSAVACMQGVQGSNPADG